MAAAASQKRTDAAVLALCVGMVLLSRCLCVDGAGRVSYGSGGGCSVPTSCLFKALCGLDCPSCGMTRSFVALAHANLRAAWRYNRVGPALFIFVLLQIPYRALRLLSPGLRLRTAQLDGKITLACMGALTLFLLVNWCVYLFGTHSPMP